MDNRDSISEAAATSPSLGDAGAVDRNGISPPETWPERRQHLLPPPNQVPPARPGGASGGAAFSPDRRLELAAAYCLRKWLRERKAFRIAEMWQGVAEFKVAYRSANALGTFLQKGVAGHGIGLRATREEFRPLYFNAHQIMSRLSSAQVESTACQLGFADAESLCVAIRELPDAER